jgi:hypothetical protein
MYVTTKQQRTPGKRNPMDYARGGVELTGVYAGGSASIGITRQHQ